MRRLPWILGLGVFVLSFVTPVPQLPFLLGFSTSHSTQVTVLALLAVLAAISAALSPRTMWPVTIVAVVSWIVAGAWAPLAVAAWCAGLRFSRKWAIVASAVGILLVGIPTAIAGGRSDLGTFEVVAVSLASAGMLFCLPFSLGRLYGFRTRIINELVKRAAQLEREKAALEAQARAEERAAIAREMHDLVAHRVAIMVLHAGALELEAGNPSMAERSGLIAENGRLALAELRQVLGILRTPSSGKPTPPPSLDDIEALVAATRAAGLPVTLQHEGEVRPLAEAVQRAAHRVVREALTNVLKHAGRVRTTVTLRYLPETLVIRVENDKPATALKSTSDGGLGLVGLAERLKVMNGTFRTERLLDGGFLVVATIPDWPQ